jgi:DNA polymerase-3 subunit alpha
MKEVDGDLELLKLDVLGLRNLSIVKETVERIKKRHNIFIDFKKIDFNDNKTYKMLQSGNTVGVFQLESHIMQKLLKDIKPTKIEDISIVNACARPGALNSGLTEMYIRRRNGTDKVNT